MTSAKASASPKDLFDLGKIITELKSMGGRISFEDIDGLGSPVVDEEDGEELVTGSTADLATRQKSGRWTLPF